MPMIEGIPLGCTCHSPIQKTQHGNGSSHDVEDSEVGCSERVKNQSGSVKRDEHCDAHLGIKVSCVFYDTRSSGHMYFIEKN